MLTALYSSFHTYNINGQNISREKWVDGFVKDLFTSQKQWIREDRYAIQIITKLLDTMESNISDVSC